eukprot:873533_1
MPYVMTYQVLENNHYNIQYSNCELVVNCGTNGIPPCNDNAATIMYTITNKTCNPAPANYNVSEIPSERENNPSDKTKTHSFEHQKMFKLIETLKQERKKIDELLKKY